MFKKLLKNKGIKYSLVAIACVLVIGVGFLMGSNNYQDDQKSNDVAIDNQSSNDNEDTDVQSNLDQSLNQVTQGANVVNESSKIVYEYEYDLCGHIYEEYHEPTDELIGLNEQGLKDFFTEARSVEFSENEVRVKFLLNQICPQHVLLKYENGRCVVYRNKMGTEEMVAEQTFSIDEDSWDSEWLSSLEQGVVFESIKELESFVEDMES